MNRLAIVLTRLVIAFASIVVSAFLISLVLHSCANARSVTFEETPEGVSEAFHDFNKGLTFSGYAGSITGAWVGSGMIVNSIIDKHFIPLTKVNNVQYYRFVNPGTYFLKGIGGGMLIGYGAGAVAVSSYAITTGVRESGVKGYHKKVVEFYQEYFDNVMDYYKGVLN